MNKKERVAQKSGMTNVLYKNISKKRRKYISDLYTTLLDSTWGHCVLLFSASFFTSWLLFASFYYFLAFLHGDFAEHHLPDTQEQTKWIPCILGIDGFLSCFLFSLETQQTIGYGTRAITTNCPDVMLVVSVQVEYLATTSRVNTFHVSVCVWSACSSTPSWSHFLQVIQAQDEDKDCNVQSMCGYHPTE